MPTIHRLDLAEFTRAGDIEDVLLGFGAEPVHELGGTTIAGRSGVMVSRESVQINDTELPYPLTNFEVIGEIPVETDLDGETITLEENLGIRIMQ